LYKEGRQCWQKKLRREDNVDKKKKEGRQCWPIYIYIYIYVWKLNQTVLELDFRAVKFCSSLDGIWTPTIDTLQHHSLSLTSSALDHIHSLDMYLKDYKRRGDNVDKKNYKEGRQCWPKKTIRRGDNVHQQNYLRRGDNVDQKKTI
jgi:hypothetical protein